jgi:hypothetical protein
MTKFFSCSSPYTALTATAAIAAGVAMTAPDAEAQSRRVEYIRTCAVNYMTHKEGEPDVTVFVYKRDRSVDILHAWREEPHDDGLEGFFGRVLINGSTLREDVATFNSRNLQDPQSTPEKVWARWASWALGECEREADERARRAPQDPRDRSPWAPPPGLDIPPSPRGRYNDNGSRGNGTVVGSVHYNAPFPFKVARAG